MQRLKEMMRSPKWAPGLTIVWLLGVALVLCLAQYGDPKQSVLQLANFIAVSCSIPALVWLVVGYYRQGQELQKQEQNLKDQLHEFKKQNATLARQTKVLKKQRKAHTKQALALEAQGKALEEQARHSKDLVELVGAEGKRVQAREARQAEPILILSPETTDGKQAWTTLANRGGGIHDMTFCHDDPNRFAWPPENSLGTNESVELILVQVPPRKARIEFSLTCLDAAGQRHRFKFQRTPPNGPWKQVGHAKPDTSEE